MLVTVNAAGCGSGRSTQTPAPSGYTTYLGSADRAPAQSEDFPDSLRSLWTQKVGRAVVGGIVLGNRIVAAQDVHRSLVVLERETGNRIWRKRLKGPGITQPIIVGNLIVSGTGGREGAVHAFDVASGNRRWKRKLPYLNGPIAASDSMVFATSERGLVTALSLKNGRTRWDRRTGAAIRSGVTLTPGGQGVFFATEDSLLIVSPEDGSNIAGRKTPGGILEPPAVSDSLLVVTSPDGIIAAYAASDLRETWRVETSDPIFGSAAVARDTVFAVTLGGTLWRVPLGDAAGATRLELHRTVRTSPSPLKVGVLIGTTGGEVMWVVDDPNDPRWRVSLPGPILVPPQLDAGQVVIADGRGKLHSWR